MPTGAKEAELFEGPERDDRRFAQNMVVFREAQGMSQADLVRALKQHGWTSVYQNTVSRIEKGDRPVRYGEARTIARALGVEIEKFLLSAADSQDAADLATARVRIEHASHQIFVDARKWYDARDQLEQAISTASEHGIEPTELPEDEGVDIVPTTAGDELALAIKALSFRIDGGLIAAQVLHDRSDGE